ncbi:MAG: hypothetical protein ACI4CY_06190, partial [Candidatus Gastranaerophilaceae bacterium]
YRGVYPTFCSKNTKHPSLNFWILNKKPSSTSGTLLFVIGLKLNHIVRLNLIQKLLKKLQFWRINFNYPKSIDIIVL